MKLLILKTDKTIALVLCAWLPAAVLGANMIRDPGAENPAPIADYPDAGISTSCPDGFYAPGWGVYNGGCVMSWGVTDTVSHAGTRAVCMCIIRPIPYKGKFFYSGSLLLGEGNGYSGAHALALMPDTRYKFVVWLKVSDPHEVSVYITGFLRRRGKHIRRAVRISSLLLDGQAVAVQHGSGVVMADTRWRKVEGVFQTDDIAETVNIAFSLKRHFDRREDFRSVTLFADDAEVVAQ